MFQKKKMLRYAAKTLLPALLLVSADKGTGRGELLSLLEAQL